MMNYMLPYVTFIYAIPFLILAIRNGFSAASMVGLVTTLGFYVGVSPFLLMTRFRLKNNIKRIPSYRFRQKPLMSLAYVVLVLYVIFRINFLSQLLIDPTSIFISLMETMQSISEERYKSGFSESESVIYQIGTVFFYLLMGLIGAVFSYKNCRKYFWLGVVLIVLLIEMLEGTRARAVIGLTFFFSEYLFSNNTELQGRSLFSGFKAFSISIFCLILVFALPQYARIYDSDNPFEIIFIEKLPGYSFAAHDAFRVWMEKWDGELGLGVNTFAGVAKLFGGKFQQGFYEFINTDFGSTNLFTNLRNLYSDFGIIVTPFIFVIFGFLIGYVSNKRVNFFVAVFAKFIVVYILFFLYSPFIFFNAFAGFAVLIIAFFFLWDRNTSLENGRVFHAQKNNPSSSVG